MASYFSGTGTLYGFAGSSPAGAYVLWRNLANAPVALRQLLTAPHATTPSLVLKEGSLTMLHGVMGIFTRKGCITLRI